MFTSTNLSLHLLHRARKTLFSKPHHSLPNPNQLHQHLTSLCRTRRYNDALALCLRRSALSDAFRVHALAKSSGFNPPTRTTNRLITLFANSGRLDDARKLFDEMGERDSCSWNALISGYARNGRVAEARGVFDGMGEEVRDGVSWSAMMSGYVRNGRPSDALELYREMHVRRVGSTRFMVSIALAAAGALLSLRYGREIHGHVLRVDLEMDSVVWSALSDVYGKCGYIDEARRAFEECLDKDVVSWTAMMGWYFDVGRVEDGFMLFRDMMMGSLARPNEFTYSSVLTACSSQCMEGLGKQVHANMIRGLMDDCPFAAATLVDMYAKCGNVASAENVFKGMRKPDVVSWSSIISCHAQNGQPELASRHFKTMLESGIKPDSVSFIGALSACTHAELVDEGLRIFHSIVEVHGLTHTSDHYACVVDLLSRSGRFEEVVSIMKKMTMKPDKFLWASLLNGCRMHGNVSLAQSAAAALFEIEPENPATFVTLANIYASLGMWDDVASVRNMMGNLGVVKNPGSSWIEVKGQLHYFLAGDNSHPRTKEIYSQLEKLIFGMKKEGYVPETSFVLHDVEEEQKEQNLVHHSEKLAIAFGIISTPPCTRLKIFKNLRICGDCHTAVELISKITEREIVVRDPGRFHHFRQGTCTCKGYW